MVVAVGCVGTGVAQQHAANVSASEMQMTKLAKALGGTWSITIKDEPGPENPKGETYSGKEIWSSPGGGPVMEQFSAKSSSGEQAESALFWWDLKTSKYHGLWCAPINDDGCNGFEAHWEGNRLINDGEWAYQGHRSVWHEIFEVLSPTEFVQTLFIGEPGGELKLVSTIRGTKVASH